MDNVWFLLSLSASAAAAAAYFSLVLLYTGSFSKCAQRKQGQFFPISFHWPLALIFPLWNTLLMLLRVNLKVTPCFHRPL